MSNLFFIRRKKSSLRHVNCTILIIIWSAGSKVTVTEMPTIFFLHVGKKNEKFQTRFW